VLIGGILFHLDECVPESVGDVLRDKGHNVESIRLFVPKGTADSIIAAIGEQDAAILVTVDKDLRAFAPRIPKERRRYKKLGIISLRCPEPQAQHRIRQNIDLIEFEYARSQYLRDRRVMISIGTNFVWVER
jgi:predicted nuclease of predicted toxin-antitoxin system